MNLLTTRTSGWMASAVLSIGIVFPSPSPVGAQQFQLEEATIASVHAALDSGQLTCRALVQGYLDRIAAYDQRGLALNSIQNLNPRALAQADSLDAARAERGRQGTLHCVPVLLKDQVETRGYPTTYGSALFRDFVSDRDATLVTRLQDAGAIILAKTTMGEFASRYVGSMHGIIRNAYDLDRNPSGSSGGSGTAVAANFGLVGIGEDTGGSVRGPAAVSNLVGLRPTLELVSRQGMMPANPTQDTMGPMTRTVEDAARVLDVIAGYDPLDPITAETVGRLPESYLSGLTADALRGVRIGLLQTTTQVPVEHQEAFAQVSRLMEEAVAALRALGAEVVGPFSIAEWNAPRPSNNFETEAATDAYLAELTNPPVRTLREILLSGVVVPWRAAGMIGSVGKTTRDPGYLEVIHSRAALRNAVLREMADRGVDVLVHATFDAPPTRIAPDVLTNPAPNDDYGLGDNRNLSPAIGFPALTVPAGFTPDGLPIGLEFLGRPFSEGDLFGYAFAFEQATRHRRPPASAPPLGGR